MRRRCLSELSKLNVTEEGEWMHLMRAYSDCEAGDWEHLMRAYSDCEAGDWKHLMRA